MPEWVLISDSTKLWHLLSIDAMHSLSVRNIRPTPRNCPYEMTRNSQIAECSDNTGH